LNSNVEIANGIVAINTANYPSLNKPAKITLYGLSYSSIPQIYYTNSFITTASGIGTLCSSTSLPSCNLTNYTEFSTTNGQAMFDVSGFSSFMIAGSGAVYDLSKLDIDECEKGIQGNLVLEMKNPEEDDSFGPGENIELKVKVSNENDIDKRIIVKGILFNIDEDDEEASEESDSQKVEAGDTETFEAMIKVPNNFKEENTYILFVKAYEKGKESSQCNYEIVDLSLERAEHEVKITNAELSSEISYPNGKIDFEIEVKNTGSNNEDVYVKISNTQLGIEQKTEVFEIEEYGEEDKENIYDTITIPSSTADGNYSFKIEVVFEDGSNYTNEIISVLNSTTPQVESNVIYASQSSGSSGGSGSSGSSSSAIMATQPSTTVTGSVIATAPVESKSSDSILKLSLASEGTNSANTISQKSMTTSKKYLYIAGGLIVGIIILGIAIVVLGRKRD
jgi:hypothetical protein